MKRRTIIIIGVISLISLIAYFFYNNNLEKKKAKQEVTLEQLLGENTTISGAIVLEDFMIGMFKNSETKRTEINDPQKANELFKQISKTKLKLMELGKEKDASTFDDYMKNVKYTSKYSSDYINTNIQNGMVPARGKISFQCDNKKYSLLILDVNYDFESNQCYISHIRSHKYEQGKILNDYIPTDSMIYNYIEDFIFNLNSNK